MTAPLFAFCADLQARESAYRSVKELQGDDLYALQQVVEYCKDDSIPLILGGDQVDTPTISDEHTVKLRKLLQGVIQNEVFYVDGNHERGFKRFCLEGGSAAVAQNLEDRGTVGMYTNPTVKGPTVIKRRKSMQFYRDSDLRATSPLFEIAGYNWRTRRQWESYLESQPLVKADILILHGFASQVVPYLGLPPDEAPLCDLDLNWFDGKYKLVLMGDIHMEWEWTGPKGTRFMYSGSMWMHRLGEPEDKSFIVVYDDLSTERIPLKCRPFKRLKVSSEEDIKNLKKWLDKECKNTYPEDMVQLLGQVKPRIHLTIPSELSKKAASAIELMKEKAFVFEKIDTSHDTDLSENEGSVDGQVDMDTALVQVLGQEDQLCVEAAEFIKQTLALGFDTAIDNLKKKMELS